MPGSREAEREFVRNRKVVLAASGGLCVKCGRLASEVHHVNGREDARLEMLRPLCAWCHLFAPNGDQYWGWETLGYSGVEICRQKCRVDVPEASEADFSAAFRIAIEFRDSLGTKSEQTTRGHQANREQGKPIGPAPYGYRSQGRDEAGKTLPLLEDENEQAIARWIKDASAAGKSLREIADALNEAGTKTRKGGAWRHQYVAGVLNAS